MASAIHVNPHAINANHSSTASTAQLAIYTTTGVLMPHHALMAPTQTPPSWPASPASPHAHPAPYPNQTAQHVYHRTTTTTICACRTAPRVCMHLVYTVLTVCHHVQHAVVVHHHVHLALLGIYPIIPAWMLLAVHWAHMPTPPTWSAKHAQLAVPRVPTQPTVHPAIVQYIYSITSNAISYALMAPTNHPSRV